MNWEDEAECAICGEGACGSQYIGSRDVTQANCPACGDYFAGDLSFEVLESDKWWTEVRRAALSHLIRTKRNLPFYSDTTIPWISHAELERLKKENISLPTRLVQMDNLVRYLGDLELEKGSPDFEAAIGLQGLIGAPSEESLGRLAMDMVDEGLLSDSTTLDEVMGAPPTLLQARLSLAGWKRWEQLARGDTRSKDGFIAMQFGDARLDAFINDVLKPGVDKHLGVAVNRVDSPDTVKAGLIDNVMREAIEDAAFVLVDLSHGNKGAYWEAGLAEGLGKPVIYLCEQAVWDDPRTRPHFDVNHRTTIMWDEANPEKFVTTLVATIKNSLRHRYN
ncbi:hypothetical protein [Henriciella litoralis]|uniref:hypothetical protein n=1 Tax=Henriciella litoralis TaxID=568102 RepID=UPI000A00863D|nr:hypothetical protein [Henriciella litoralis]